MRRSKLLKRKAVYYLIRWFVWFYNIVPRKAAQAIGAWIGVVIWALAKKDRYRTIRHLTLAYGDTLTRRQRQHICREFFVNTSKNLADVIRFRNHFEEIKQLVTVEGLEHYHAAFEKGNGVIGITGHIGNFELLAAYMATYEYPTAVIAREIYDRNLEQLVSENRKAAGITVFSTTDSPRKILRWLKANGVLGVLIDTDSSRVRGEFIPWFGRPANTPVGQAILGLRAGSVFLPIACVRTPDNKYRIIVKPPVTVELTGDTPADTRRITEVCVRELEEIITAHKSQWIWLHNRWHTKPEKYA